MSCRGVPALTARTIAVATESDERQRTRKDRRTFVQMGLAAWGTDVAWAREGERERDGLKRAVRGEGP